MTNEELRAENERLAAALAEQEQKADRLATQAGDISGWLREAGCPAMPIPEGVKWLLHRAEHAEAALVSLQSAFSFEQQKASQLEASLAAQEAVERETEILRSRVRALQREIAHGMMCHQCGGELSAHASGDMRCAECDASDAAWEAQVGQLTADLAAVRQERDEHLQTAEHWKALAEGRELALTASRKLAEGFRQERDALQAALDRQTSPHHRSAGEILIDPPPFPVLSPGEAMGLSENIIVIPTDPEAT